MSPLIESTLDQTTTLAIPPLLWETSELLSKTIGSEWERTPIASARKGCVDT